MFYLMDKKELNRNYGEFNGWGSAYNQFENIFETGRGGSVPPKTKQSIHRNYSHIDTLKKLKEQRMAKLAPVTSIQVDLEPNTTNPTAQSELKTPIDTVKVKKVHIPELQKAGVAPIAPKTKTMKRSRSHMIRSNKANLRLFNLAMKGGHASSRRNNRLNHGPSTAPFGRCKSWILRPLKWTNDIQLGQE